MVFPTFDVVFVVHGGATGSGLAIIVGAYCIRLVCHRSNLRKALSE